MRKLKVLTLLLGLASLVSAARESIDDGYSYRRLTENGRESSDEVNGGSGRRSNITARANGRNKSTIIKREDGSYDKDAYLATLYYYNTHYETEKPCTHSPKNNYCSRMNTQAGGSLDDDTLVTAAAIFIGLFCIGFWVCLCCCACSKDNRERWLSIPE